MCSLRSTRLLLFLLRDIVTRITVGHHCLQLIHRTLILGIQLFVIFEHLLSLTLNGLVSLVLISYLVIVKLEGVGVDSLINCSFLI